MRTLVGAGFPVPTCASTPPQPHGMETGGQGSMLARGQGLGRRVTPGILESGSRRMKYERAATIDQLLDDFDAREVLLRQVVGDRLGSVHPRSSPITSWPRTISPFARRLSSTPSRRSATTRPAGSRT